MSSSGSYRIFILVLCCWKSMSMYCVEDWSFYSILFDCINITSHFPQFINLLLILGGGAIIEARG